jgi:CRP-like cAMP-binding protein
MSEVLREVLDSPDFPKGVNWDYASYEAGEVVLKEGEDSREVYLVLEGSVQVNKQVKLKDGKNMQSGIGELHPGDAFGELNLFDAMPRSATVIAQTGLKVARIDGGRLVDFLESRPDIGYRFLKDIFLHITALLRKSDERMIGLFSWGLRAHNIDQHL